MTKSQLDLILLAGQKLSNICYNLGQLEDAPKDWLRIKTQLWKGARAAEWDGLENRYRSNPIEGSNPSLSAG